MELTNWIQGWIKKKIEIYEKYLNDENCKYDKEELKENIKILKDLI